MKGIIKENPDLRNVDVLDDNKSVALFSGSFGIIGFKLMLHM